MTQEERDALRSLRAQAQLVRALRDRLARETRGRMRSIWPEKAGAETGGGLDIRAIRIEEMARMLAREEARLRRMDKKARHAIAGMKAEHYAFCSMYYFEGMSIPRAAEAIDRSERQCLRYKKEIEAEE